MTLDKLIDRLQTIRNQHPIWGAREVCVQVAREIPDKRRIGGVRTEWLHAHVHYASGGDYFLGDEAFVELIADALTPFQR